MTKSSQEFESWMNRTWRPATAWAYIVICIFDFLVFPILWSVLQAAFSGSVSQPWTPITLHGGGLLHLSMGAILGIYAFSRGQEKLLRDRYDRSIGDSSRNSTEDFSEQAQAPPRRPNRPRDLE